MKTRIASLCMTICAAAAIEACSQSPSTYSAGVTYGRVIDAETRQPVSGALVVAQWVLQGGLEGHSIGTLVAREAVTNDAGDFRIEGWGPLPRPASGRLDQDDPEIVIFKSGYRVMIASHVEMTAPHQRDGLEVRNSLWNGSTHELLRNDKGHNRDDATSLLATRLRESFEKSKCSWTSIPRAIRALDRERRELGELLRIVGPKLLSRTDCGSLGAFKIDYEGTQ